MPSDPILAPEVVARLTKLARDFDDTAERFRGYHQTSMADGDATVWNARAAEEEQVAADLRALLSAYAAQGERIKELERVSLSGAWVLVGPNMRWAQVQRLRFIGHLIETQGYVNRADLMNKFGISMSQASIDLREFQRWSPNRLHYDRQWKRYECARAALSSEPGEKNDD